MLHPFMLLIDRSGSMEGDAIAAVNEHIPNMIRVLADEPDAVRSALLSIVAFNSTAKVVMPLGRVSEEVADDFKLSADYTTSFSAAFSIALKELERGRRKFSGQHWQHPVIFFLSDGAPDRKDSWLTALEALKEFDPKPHIYPIALGDFNVEVLKKVSSDPTFDISVSSEDPKALIRRVVSGITRSIHVATSNQVESMADLVTEVMAPHSAASNLDDLISDEDFQA